MLKFSPSPRANALAVIAIFAILAGAGGIVIGGQHKAERSGPRTLAVSPDGEELYANIDGRLFRLSTDGVVLTSAPLAELGIDPLFSDLAVDREAVWIPDPQSGELLRCSRNLRTCRSHTKLPKEVQGRVIHLARAPKGGFFMVGGSRGKVARVSKEGRLINLIEAPGGWNAPNTVASMADGRIVVADANNHRLVLVDPETGDRAAVTIDVATDLSRTTRRWPVAAKQALNGDIWSINGDGMLEYGDVLVYSLEGRVQHRVDLGESADPIALVRLGSDMLVADFRGSALYRVDARGNVQSFGKGDLARTLKEVRNHKSQWAAVANAGWAGLVFGGFLAVLAGLLDWRAQRERTSPGRHVGRVTHPEDISKPDAWPSPERAIRPDYRGIIWMGLSVRVRRLFQLGALMSLGGLFVFPGLLGDGGENLNAAASAVFALFGGLTAMFIFLVIRISQIRIGSNGRRLYIRDLFGRQAEAPIEEVVFTGRRFMIGSVAVPAQQQNNVPYDSEHYGAYIRPLVDSMKETNEFKLLWRQLIAGKPMAWLQVFSAVAVIGLWSWMRFM